MQTTSPNDFRLDRRKVRAAFEQSAATYDAVAGLQRDVASQLLDRLQPVRIEPQMVVDLGAGTGAALRPLAKRYRAAKLLAIDLAVAMMRIARARARSWIKPRHFVCADAEFLPLRDRSVDLIFSNLALQWCDRPDAIFREFGRVLAPGGLVVFSTLGPDTLKELRESWSIADGYNHVNAFLDMHDVGDALVSAGLRDVVLDVERLTRSYRDVFELMRELKALGAHNVTGGRPRGLTGRQRLSAMRSAYERFRCDGLLPASYEVVFAHAWSPAAPRVELSADLLEPRRRRRNGSRPLLR